MPAVRPRFHLAPCSKFRSHLTHWANQQAPELTPHETDINRRHPRGRHLRCDNERKRPARHRVRNRPQCYQWNNPWREGWTRLLQFRSIQHRIKGNGQRTGSNRGPEKARIRPAVDPQCGASTARLNRAVKRRALNEKPSPLREGVARQDAARWLLSPRRRCGQQEQHSPHRRSVRAITLSTSPISKLRAADDGSPRGGVKR